MPLLLASSPAQARKAVNDKGGDMGNDDVDGKQDDHECVAERGQAAGCVKVEENPHENNWRYGRKSDFFVIQPDKEGCCACDQ